MYTHGTGFSFALVSHVTRYPYISCCYDRHVIQLFCKSSSLKTVIGERMIFVTSTETKKYWNNLSMIFMGRQLNRWKNMSAMDGICTCNFCQKHALSFINVAGAQSMHMQMKPAQRYFRHEKKNTLPQIWHQTNILSTQWSMPITMVHPNFWIGTFKHSENSEFCPGLCLKAT